MKKMLAILSLVVGISATALSTGMAAEKPKKGERPDPETIFKKLDKDSNGELTKSEFLGKREGEKAERATAMFAKLDKDKNGTVSKEEFMARGKKKAK